MKKLMKDKNCPFCYEKAMGLSPEGWIVLQEIHEREHLPQCPICKQPIKNQ